MINIHLKPIGDSIQDKIDRIRLYRLYTIIQGDIEKYLNEYNVFDIRFSFIKFKEELSIILNNHGVEYRFEYDYDKYSDNVKVFIGKNFVLDIKIIPEKDYHI